MPASVRNQDAALCLMHTRGRPEEWRTQAKLPAEMLVETICAGLSESLAVALRAGIAAEAVVLDPGYGFGKKFDENYTVLAHQAEFLALGRPLLAGLYRANPSSVTRWLRCLAVMQPRSSPAK